MIVQQNLARAELHCPFIQRRAIRPAETQPDATSPIVLASVFIRSIASATAQIRLSRDQRRSPEVDWFGISLSVLKPPPETETCNCQEDNCPAAHPCNPFSIPFLNLRFTKKAVVSQFGIFPPDSRHEFNQALDHVIHSLSCLIIPNVGSQAPSGTRGNRDAVWAPLMTSLLAARTAPPSPDCVLS